MERQSTTRSGDRDGVITAAGIIAILLVGWFAYTPGLHGAFTFDDLPNLAQLQNVDDRVSAIRFVFTGKAGPTGRPLAMASFLPQADEWENGARSFLTVNLLLHLLNGALVTLLLRMLARRLGLQAAQINLVALAGGAIWLLLPILASTTLVVVQRMTLLSSAFVLAGAIGYLAARSRLDERPRAALAGMSLSLGAATALSVLCKENGALLPTLILIVEATVLKAPQPTRIWRAFVAVALVAPTALICAYLLYRGFYSEELLAMRGFSGTERVLTQALILWEYLFRAFAPLPGSILPYNDGHAIARSLADPVTLLAVAGWIVALGAAIRVRRRQPVFAFAVLWYLGAHLLESTTLPLELVFDHRNYVPLIGPAFALAYLPVALRSEYRQLGYASLGAYAALLAVVLFGTTSRMGQPDAHAAWWYEQAPASVRAATTYATQQIAAGDFDGALDSLHRFVDKQPQHGYLLIQDLNIACLLRPRGDHGERVSHLAQVLPEVAFSLTTGVMLRELLASVSRIECNGVGDGTVAALATAVMQNPSYGLNSTYSGFHHALMANIYRSQGDIASALRHIEQAAELRPSMDTTTMVVSSHVANEDYAAARLAIAAARDAAPRHPAKRFLWFHDLGELQRFVDSVETEPTGDR